MSQKVILISDPGIDGAFAVALALYDPNVDVLGLLATAGNVSAEQATRNIHVLVEQLDPPRWPRLGAAPAVDYEIDGKRLHGPEGLGGVSFPFAALHHIPASEKLLVELVKQNPHEVTVICMGPLTVLTRAFDLYAELPTVVKRLICMGGTLAEPGNVGPVTEFHFTCDPVAARKVLGCGAPITLVPLDVMRKVLFSPSDLLGLPTDGPRACRFLRQIVPFGIAATSNLYGIEGFHVKDVLGVIALAQPEALQTKPMRVDVETRGELTRGMSVFDQRPWETGMPNVDLAVEVSRDMVRGYMERVLNIKGETGK
jgi:inosine-uridine nucleoside N-ribohydrolase